MRKKLLMPTILLVLLISGMMAMETDESIENPFIEKYYYPNTLIVCFTMESVGNSYGIVEYEIVDGVIHTGIESFNELAKRFKIIDIEPVFENVTHPEWNEDGIYLQNIFKLHLESNDHIEKANVALDKDESIVYCEYDSRQFLLYTPNDSEYYRQWYHPVINTPAAWDHVKGSKEVVVAITDTGVKWNHPDLADNIWINEAELPGITIEWETGRILGGDGRDNDGNGKIDDVMGWDFAENNNNPYQNYTGNSHGSHVAGIAGAVGDNEIGVAGVAMTVSLMVCKGAPSNAPSDGIVQGVQQIQYAAQSRADVINCSWITYTNYGNTYNSAVNYATALGSLVVAGAGNDNKEHTTGLQAYPSDADNAISVAAVGSNDVKAYFSDYGAPIDIAAPGVNILSTGHNDTYYTAQGTSMATPVIAGTAALVKAINPDMTPEQVKGRILSTADDIDEINPNYVGKLGSGRVNVFRAAMSDRMPYLTIFDHYVEEYDGDGDGIPNPGEEVGIVFSIFNDIGWLRAEDVVGTLSTDMPGVEITAPVIQYPNIDGGSIVFNTNEPFRFKTASDLIHLKIPFKLTIEANEHGTFPFKDTFEIEVKLSLQKVGWPLLLVGSSTSPATITDIDDDGTNEIIFGDAQGNLHAVKADKSRLDGFPVELGSNINSAVAIADLEDDGQIRIVANTLAGMIYCLDNQGETLFKYDADGQFRNNPLLVDLNNDGYCEIVAATFTNPKLIVLNPDGTDFLDFPIPIASGVMSALAAADLNGDGNKEIIFVTSKGILHAISIITGEDIEGFPHELGGSSWSGPMVGDVTGDGFPEIAIATIQGNVIVYNKDGERIISRVAGCPIRTDVLIFDLDQDGNNELIFGDMSGNLYVTDSEGNDIEPFPVNIGAAIESTPILADMTMNDQFEIVFGDGQGNLHSISLQGENTPNFPISLDRAFSVSPAIGYVDSMENPGILIPNSNGYQYVDFKRTIGAIGWGTYRGNPQRTGQFKEVTSAERLTDLVPLTTFLNGNYPNPFNPNTTISFSVGEVAGRGDIPVNITVYNIRGQAVTTLLDEHLTPGNYQAHWNGRDKNNAEVSSGVYFYTLRCADLIQTKKMMLIK